MFTAALFTVAKTYKQPKCPIDRGVDKEGVCAYKHGILIIKKEIIPFAAIWMDRDDHTKTNIWCHSWTLKYYTNELIYKTEMDSQVLKINLCLPKGKLGVGGW